MLWITATVPSRPCAPGPGWRRPCPRTQWSSPPSTAARPTGRRQRHAADRRPPDLAASAVSAAAISDFAMSTSKSIFGSRLCGRTRSAGGSRHRPEHPGPRPARPGLGPVAILLARFSQSVARGRMPRRACHAGLRVLDQLDGTTYFPIDLPFGRGHSCWIENLRGEQALRRRGTRSRDRRTLRRQERLVPPRRSPC